MKAFAPCLEVNLEAIASNFQTIQKKAPLSECAPVLKADAYGMGAKEVSRFLCQEFSVKTFFVATLSEGAALRKNLAQAGFSPLIYVLEGLLSNPAQCELFRKFSLSPVLNTFEEVKVWQGVRSEKPPSALQVNLGFNRYGIDFSELSEIAQDYAPELLLAHLSCASVKEHPHNLQELHKFHTAASFFPKAKKSLSASAGIFLGEAYHFDLVRPGIALYSPLNAEEESGLENACSFSALLAQVRPVPKGSFVGYDATWVASQNCFIGTVAAGYADGIATSWNRKKEIRGFAKASGEAFPIVGRVSMDSFMLDLGAAPQCVRGEWIYLFSPEFPAVRLAGHLGMSVHELLTVLGNAPRCYRKYSRLK